MLTHCRHTRSSNLQLGYLPCVPAANSSSLQDLWVELVLGFLMHKLELPAQASGHSHHLLTIPLSLLPVVFLWDSAGVSSHSTV